jgi:hypothetical protein
MSFSEEGGRVVRLSLSKPNNMDPYLVQPFDKRRVTANLTILIQN